jgi:uncharacterized membrane protein required for colicin V production
VFGLGGLVAGIWLAAVAGAEAQSVVAGVVGVDWVAAVLARMLLVIACLTLCLIAGWGIEKTLEALHMGWLNRLAGALLAGLVGVVLLAVIVGVAARVSPDWEDWTEDSVLTDSLEEVWEVVADPEPQEADTVEAEPADAPAEDSDESDVEPTVPPDDSIGR